MADGPPSIELIRWLFAFHEWAGAHTFEAAAAVSSEAAKAPGLIAGGQGDGSLHETLAHIAGAEELWLGRWEGNQRATIRTGEHFGSIGEIHEAWRAGQRRRAALLRLLNQQHLAGVLHYIRVNGQAEALPMWQTLLHLSNHTTHHRAEACVALSALGHPVAPVDMIDFMRLGPGR